MNALHNLKIAASKQVEKFPQYSNHFNDYVLGIITKKVISRHKDLIFDKDNIVLINPDPVNYFCLEDDSPHFLIWDFTMKMDTIVSKKHFRFLEKEG
jgi:hypothetical protein